MICRNKTCATEIENRLYCPLCGYPNSELGLSDSHVCLNSNIIEGEFMLNLENRRFHPIDARVFVREASSEIFDLSDSIQIFPNDDMRIEAGESAKILIRYKLRDTSGIFKSSDNPAFKLAIESNDGIDERFPKRSRKAVANWQITEYPISIDIVEPGKLAFDKNFASFGIDDKNKIIQLSHASGSSDAEIISINLPENFQSEDIKNLMNSSEKIIKQGDKPFEFILEYTGSFNDNIETELELEYISTSETYYEKIKIFVVKRAMLWTGDSSKPIPDYIVAIDFGTSKTVASYIKTQELWNDNGDPVAPNVEMVELKHIGHEGQHDIPSVIAIDRGRYVIGRMAANIDYAPRADYIKMSLQEDNIIFSTNDGREKIQKPTGEVLTNYLAQLKNYFPEEIRESDSVLYVFTLPVLDNETENAPRYNKQKEITLRCAEKAFRPDNEKAIEFKTLTESEAAMFYILNAITYGEMRMPRDLKDGNIIGVFDFGAGTLDITFGKYSLSDGIPTIDPLGSVGLFEFKEKEEGKEVSLGGNRIDHNLGMQALNILLEQDAREGRRSPLDITKSSDSSVSPRLLDSFSFGRSSPKSGDVSASHDSETLPSVSFVNPISENGILLNFESFGEYGFYNDLPRQSFERHYVKNAKERIALIDQSGSILMDGKSIYEGYDFVEGWGEESDYIICDSEMLNNVIDTDIDHAINKIIQTMSEKDIASIRYFFMVGGSSLIRHVAKRLGDELGTKVFTPYDYVGFSGEPDSISHIDDDRDTAQKNIISIRDSAVCAVVKGAALSLVTRVDKIFQFGVTIRKKDGTEFKSYNAGDAVPSHPFSERHFPQFANGIWEIYAVTDNSEILVDNFLINESTQQPITFSIHTTGRKLSITCKAGVRNVMKDTVTKTEKQEVEFTV
ncbi:MAG: hypothetical protein FWD01_00685 [Defluviitaleaceae bacterium]|nr:hypothetical protein [Defluviitaleaceae bacterium]